MTKRHRVCGWILAPILAFSTGCITVYHPLSGLQTPVVVDPALGNFHELRLLVHCVPQDLLEGEAGILCQRVKQLFENQGAEVKTITSLSRRAEEERFEVVETDDEDQKDDKKTVEAPRPDLIVELRARHQHENTDYTMWTLSMFTLTLAPGISENTFVQEVVIRDARGSLLGSGELKGRIVRYFGFGYWATNKILDLLARDDDEELTDDRLSESLCDDLYGQLSQMVFNANMRRQVLSRANPSAGGDS